MTTQSTTKLTTPSERELVITRDFAAPRERVFEAWTKPEQVRQWYGLSSLTTTVCDIDLRVGGAWRWGQKAPDGQEIVFSGMYEEITPPERLVYTELFELMPGPRIHVTLTFEEKGDGVTRLRSTSVWPSAEIRDQALATGMEAGVAEEYDRLATFLARV
ncbi:SRPBCC family protein [Streptomyces purpureus]|uniref:SRPBCC family protein n=1 Tax=Streptomyces purpureus TaxID=1951 RepID=UPI0037933B4A